MSRRTVETKPYEKKYKDKKTNEWKSIKIDLARVGDRVLQLREDHPNSRILPKHKFEDNGTTSMRVYIWKDKKDSVYHEGALILDSADASGTANEVTVKNGHVENKALEKLETVATGRALALLGYTKDGQIASTEEMTEFYAYKDDQRADSIDTAITQIKATKNLDELKKVWESFEDERTFEEVVAAKDDQKMELVA